VSNLETEPAELVSPGIAATSERTPLEILLPRLVPLGGPRAMTVNRTLPQRKRSTIGAWCFCDHYGPDDVSATGGMRVPPHPHTGLQTVSWLFEGEIEHRDSVGSHAMVRPGEINLMTAGRGISHSEVSTPRTRALSGVQLWIVLPDGSRHDLPFFEHLVPEPFDLDGATVRVFVGQLAGRVSRISVFSPLVGAQIDLPARREIDVPADPAFEHGILVDAGAVTVCGSPLGRRELGYLDPGRERITLRADEPSRVLLLGGVPFGEEFIMWWNFIGRSHEEVVAFRERWQRDVIGRQDVNGPFGLVQDYDGQPLPAPELPTVRLRPRR
jgi:redox-sensitive bicupin YhaK (pirin superfamily)